MAKTLPQPIRVQHKCSHWVTVWVPGDVIDGGGVELAERYALQGALRSDCTDCLMHQYIMGQRALSGL